MTKNWLGRTIIVVVVLGLLIAGGFAVYRVGYMQGLGVAGGGTPFLADNFNGIPYGNSGWMMSSGGYPGSMMGNFNMMGTANSGYSPFGGGMMGYGGSFFSLLLLFRIAFWGFIIWLVYKLATGSQFGFTNRAAESASEE
ncbi:MAG: hypothetical protein L3J16_04155 [Anaerolineales bacterium]|nr:hypothetical protein [Anaerolineales bacterium]